MLHVRCALFGRPKDVKGCSTVDEEFLQPLFLLCSCFTVPNVCVCLCVCVCVGVCVCVCVHLLTTGMGRKIGSTQCVFTHNAPI